MPVPKFYMVLTFANGAYDPYTRSFESYDEAVAFCKKYGLTLKTNYVETSAYEAGKVISQSLRKDSEIVLVSVTVPLELFSGMEVADSNRKITTETPTYKAAGEQIDDLR